MQAQDIMTKKVISAAADTTVEQITALMMESHISAVPILDSGGSVIGIVSEGDLMRRVEGARKTNKSWWLSLFSGSDDTARDFIAMRSRRTKDIMTHKVLVVTPTTPVAEIALMLEKNQIKRVPVVENNRLVGIVSRANLLQALSATPIASLGSQTSDRRKRDIVLVALAEVPGLKNRQLNVIVKGSKVDVWGFVGSKAEEQAARVAIDNIDGVGEISLNLAWVPEYGWGM